MYQPRRRQPGMGLMLLFYQLFGVIGIDRIPPVTLGCIGLQVAIFLRLFKLPWYNSYDVCISAYKVLKKKEFLRLLYGALEHGDDWHLYYNMFSFALKGQSLERKFGSAKFLYILTNFTILTSAVLVLLSELASDTFEDYKHQCSIGFSGVIFALKVLTTYYDNNITHNIMGIPVIVPARYAVWVELLLIQIMVPNVSFFGHLAGILVGMMYVKGPLKYFIDTSYSLIKKVLNPSVQPRFTPRTERSGHANETFNDFVPPGMSEEEQLRRAMEESMQDSINSPFTNSYPYTSARTPPPPGFIFDHSFHPPPPPGFSPDIDELHNRRTSHFSNF